MIGKLPTVCFYVYCVCVYVHIWILIDSDVFLLYACFFFGGFIVCSRSRTPKNETTFQLGGISSFNQRQSWLALDHVGKQALKLTKRRSQKKKAAKDSY